MIKFDDTWGIVSVASEFEGMHPDKTVDFNLDEVEGKKYIHFYGWDKKYNQIDTSNSLGFYEFVEVSND